MRHGLRLPSGLIVAGLVLEVFPDFAAVQHGCWFATRVQYGISAGLRGVFDLFLFENRCLGAFFEQYVFFMGRLEFLCGNAQKKLASGRWLDNNDLSPVAFVVWSD
ncbi:MAG: hypothetical protein ACRCTU_13140 [Zoogloea sp.]|uniref:hypothetical protein n=1 Tax=Zoogloea sp. TaxID=49181 RepID=UPI003F3BB239